MLTVRHIQTTTVPVLDAAKQPVVENGKPLTRDVPVLDDQERDIVLWSVDVPSDVEAAGGEAIDAYVAARLAKPAGPTSASATVPFPDTAPAAEEPAE